MENKLFRMGMYWRILYGILRVLLGLALLKLVDVPLADLLYKIMGQELVEDPSDFLFTALNSFLQLHPLSVTYFLSSYLIFWGTTDAVLSINLLRHKLWAFPVSLWLIGFFILYELYRFSHTRSGILLTVITLDVAIFWFIKNEYVKLKRSPQTPQRA